MIINGMAKAGNNCLQKACLLLGVRLPVNHIPYAEKPPGRCIYIVRDPRNMLVTSVRFNNQPPVTEEKILDQIRNYMGYGPFAELRKQHEGWLTDPETDVIQYEELEASPAGIEKLAGFLGVVPKGDEFAKLPGGTWTWEEIPSDWREHWTPEIERAYL